MTAIEGRTPVEVDLLALLAEEYDVRVAELHLDSDLVDDLGIDSLGMLELSAACAERGLVLDEDQVMQLRTLGDLFALIGTVG